MIDASLVHPGRTDLGTSRVRWHVKKLARAAVALASWASGWLLLRRLVARQPRVRVLTYHRFRETPGDPFSIPMAEFTQQMEWIAEQKLAISLDDLMAFIRGEKTLRDGSVLVTVDDGYYDLWSEALPVLKRLQIPSVAFVPAGEVPDASHNGGSERRMSWNEIAGLPVHGVEVGSHSFHHRSIGSMSRDDVRFQASTSRAALEQTVRRPVTSFAYPFGTRADYNDTTRAVLADCGYDGVFTSQHGAVRRSADPLQLPRIKVEGGDGLWLFKLAVKGALDAWALIDRVAWRFQQSGRWTRQSPPTGGQTITSASIRDRRAH